MHHHSAETAAVYLDEVLGRTGVFRLCHPPDCVIQYDIFIIIFISTVVIGVEKKYKEKDDVRGGIGEDFNGNHVWWTWETLP
jgi:hypothetical protein